MNDASSHPEADKPITPRSAYIIPHTGIKFLINTGFPIYQVQRGISLRKPSVPVASCAFQSFCGVPHLSWSDKEYKHIQGCLPGY